MAGPDFDADGAVRENLADVLENGPAIRFGRRIAVAAKCPTGKHSLHTGLGAMGVGSMWGNATDEERESLEWEALPVKQCTSFGISPGEVCRENE